MKLRSLLHFVFSVCVIVLLFAAVAVAGAPSDLVKRTTDKVIDILKNKELKSPAKIKERRAAIREAISERFDFQEMAKRSLARYWKQRTQEEHTEFVALYTDLLERTYIRKIESYTDEKFVYGEESIDGNFAIVRTKVITKKNEDVPIQYMMLNENGVWLVYDVIIEGVSLVNNYRNQFNEIMHSGSYEESHQEIEEQAKRGSGRRLRARPNNQKSGRVIMSFRLFEIGIVSSSLNIHTAGVVLSLSAVSKKCGQSGNSVIAGAAFAGVGDSCGCTVILMVAMVFLKALHVCLDFAHRALQ